MPRTAFILAGGTGIANGPLGAVGPRLLLPIANRPLIEYLASVLGGVGVDRLIISLDRGSEGAVGRLNDLFHDSPLHVECVVQEIPCGTGGSLKEVEGRLREDAFWVVSGDLFLETDLRQMLAFHRELGSVATVGAFRVQEAPWEMERIEADGNRRVKAIHRIHPAQNKRSMLRPAGLYLFELGVLDLIPQGRYFDLKEQLFPCLAERGTPAGVWEIPGYCRTVFSVADYFTANQDVLRGAVRFAGIPLQSPPKDSMWASPRISQTATLLGPVVVGPSSRIGERAMVIGPTVIGENCEVEDGAILDECVVTADSRIGRRARLDRCILGEGSVVEEGAVLREMIILDKPFQAVDLATFPGNHLPLVDSGLMKGPDWQMQSRKLHLVGKRLFDVAFAGLWLVLLSPLLALIALAVKVDSRGEIVFRQRRCSRYGRDFVMYKFRTMVSNAEELKRELSSRNQVDGPMFKMIKDPRVTRLGRILRATNLDEILQLWNVLRGEMSLIGPRPLSMDEMRLNPRWRDMRLSVRPGLTGLWQVEAHDKVSFVDWIQCDLYYVRNMSPWLDLKILFKTFLQMLGLREGKR